MKRLVIAYDGTDQAKDALAFGAELARAEEAELHLAVVHFDDDRDAERERFAALFGEARSELGGGELVEHPLRDVDAASALEKLAERIHPDAIVIGSTHRGKVGRIMIGSVGERLLKGAPCSVAVAPRGYADREHFGAGVIGVGYDDSTESRLALEAAVELARAVGGSVRLIAVMPDHLTSGPIGGADIGDSQVVRADLEAALEKAAEGIAGIGVETVIEQGDVVDELAGQAVELDLLVLGSRGYGPIRRALLGGVSAPMTRVCPCPLLITPRSGEERERPVRDRSLSSALDQDADKRTAESMDR